MPHIEIGAFYEGGQGCWIYLDDPEVAKFRRLKLNKINTLVN